MKTKVLQIMSSLDRDGGVQVVVKNYYSHMNKEKFQMDFIVHGEKIGELESYFEKYGCNIFHISPRKKYPLKNISQLAKIIKYGNYNAAHCHQDYRGAVVMFLAKRYKIPVRVIHSHAAFPPEKVLSKLFRMFFSVVIKRTATVFLGCSKSACEWLYGYKHLAKGQSQMLYNAMELQKFVYSTARREYIRSELNISKKTVLCNVGRFAYQKNHDLLLDVFAQYIKQNENAVLLLVGNGELERDIRAKVQALCLEQYVYFLGVRSNIGDLLSASDVFVLSSRFEGLPLVTIEAQANGLPIVTSQMVSDEAIFVNRDLMVDKGSYYDISKWCENIDIALNRGRYDCMDTLSKAGYDIEVEAKKLENLYLTGHLD